MADIEVIKKEIALRISLFIPLIADVEWARLIGRKKLHYLVFILPFCEPNLASKPYL